MQDIERIKLKIAKLMNLAEKASNEHEAANAMSKARALMDKYQLSQIDILDVGGVATEFLKANASRAFAAVPSYLATLAVAVAKFNDCQVVYEWAHVTYKKKVGDDLKIGKVLVFRGAKLDVEMALDMFARLQGACNGICKAYFESKGIEGKYSVKLGTAFKLGAVNTIARLLQKESDETRTKLTCSNGTSLMVLKSNAVAEYFGDAEYSKAKQRKLDNQAFEAYEEGRRRANDIQIHAKQIGGAA